MRHGVPASIFIFADKMMQSRNATVATSQKSLHSWRDRLIKLCQDFAAAARARGETR